MKQNQWARKFVNKVYWCSLKVSLFVPWNIEGKEMLSILKANMAREICGLIKQGYRGVQYIGKERLGFIEGTLINGDPCLF